MITISGSGFSNILYENIVTIGGAVCDVVGASDSTIECAVGQGPMGEYPIIISVDGKGLAAYPDGKRYDFQKSRCFPNRSMLLLHVSSSMKKLI